MSAIILDVETTGLSPHKDRIVEIAIASFSDGEKLFHERLDPQIPIPPDMPHGITNEMIVDAPKFSDVARTIADLIQSAEAVIGYNPGFDRRMLAAELARCEVWIKWPTIVCAKGLWDVCEEKEKRTLTTAYKRFVSKDGFEGAHGALNDVLATRQVLMAQIQEFGLVGKEWKDLSTDVRVWYGPTDHLILEDDDTLTVNFGKHKGSPAHSTDRGYWAWVARCDFPEHVRRFAYYMRDLSSMTSEAITEYVRSNPL